MPQLVTAGRQEGLAWDSKSRPEAIEHFGCPCLPCAGPLVMCWLVAGVRSISHPPCCFISHTALYKFLSWGSGKFLSLERKRSCQDPCAWISWKGTPCWVQWQVEKVHLCSICRIIAFLVCGTKKMEKKLGGCMLHFSFN